MHFEMHLVAVLQVLHLWRYHFDTFVADGVDSDLIVGDMVH